MSNEEKVLREVYSSFKDRLSFEEFRPSSICYQMISGILQEQFYFFNSTLNAKIVTLT